jgi:hypothetical protein
MPIKIFPLLLVLSLLLGIFSCGRSERDGPEMKTNSPPVLTSVSILPEKPKQENDLGVIVQGMDPDQDSVTYHYQWIKNDAEMIGENRNVLKSGTFRKGELIQIRVTPSDGKVEGKPFLSAPVEILNSPPVIQELKIEPPIASASEDLKAVVKGFDPDGDFIYFDYKWEINGVILPEERKEILERARFKKGDSIAVKVTPDDREVTGLPKKSVAVVISNSPPIIISSPPTSIEGTIYRYQVKADDPDRDPITFTLKSGPRGMEIDKNTGLIRWGVGKEGKGTHTIEIETSDKEGATCTQRYLLIVDFKPPQ